MKDFITKKDQLQRFEKIGLQNLKSKDAVRIYLACSEMPFKLK